MSQPQTRRAFLGRAVLLAGAGLLLTGHTPYRHWDIYRQAHLLIGCHKADPETYALAQEAVSVLADRLPEAKARAARAPHPERLASLIGTGQLAVAILDRDNAFAMATGSDRFAPYGALPLQVLAPLGERLLVAHADLPERHAWLITGALVGSSLVPDTEVLEDQSPTSEGTAPKDTTLQGSAWLPWHPGSRAFLTGAPEPPRR